MREKGDDYAQNTFYLYMHMKLSKNRKLPKMVMQMIFKYVSETHTHKTGAQTHVCSPMFTSALSPKLLKTETTQCLW